MPNVFVFVALLEQGRPGRDGTPGIKVSWANPFANPLIEIALHQPRHKKMAQQIFILQPGAAASWAH